MNAKQIENLLIDAQAIVDEKFLLVPRSQRSPAAKLHCDAIRVARSALSAAAYRNFDAAIAANDVAAAREWQQIAGMAATLSTATVEMTADEAVAAIKTAIAALSAM